MKRKWKNIPNIASTSMIKVCSSRPPLTFEDNDLLDGKPNKYIPLIVWAVMENFKVRRILINQGSSADIMFGELFTKLGISIEDLTSYRGLYLSGFNRSKTMPLGYIEVMVTYDNKPLTRAVKTPFFGPSMPISYNCIIGRLTPGSIESSGLYRPLSNEILLTKGRGHYAECRFRLSPEVQFKSVYQQTTLFYS